MLRTRAAAGRSWRLLSGPVPARFRIAALVPRAAVVAVSARVRVAAAPLSRGRRAILSIGRARQARLQVGVARAAAGARRWAVWREGVRAPGRMTVSRVPVLRGRLQRLSVTAAASSVVVRVDGRVVFRGRRAALRSVSRRHLTLGLAPGAGRGNLLVAAPVVRLRGAEIPKERRRPATPPAAPAPVTPFAAPPPAAAPAAEERPYDPGFAFNQAIPAGVPSDPRSDAIVAQLDANSALSKVGLSAAGEVPPVYVARTTDPFLSVRVGGQATRFRVPAGAVAGGGADRPLVILDPDHPDFGRHTELRLWQASVIRDRPAGLGGRASSTTSPTGRSSTPTAAAA